MNKDSGKKELGELVDESFDFKHITWKISNALTLPDLVGYKEQSPTFSFAGATWRLEIYPYGQTNYASKGFIDLILVRLNSQFPVHRVFHKSCCITNDEKEFLSFSGVSIFNSNSCVGGVVRYLNKSTFTDKKDILAPNGVLTIMCQIRAKKIAVMDRYSQIESTESLLGLPSDKMVQDFKELFLKQEDSDVVIKVKGQEFQAHKNILRARSPVFASTFRNDMKEKATGVVDIEDLDPTSFLDFLCFLYCGKVENLTTENVYSLFTAADKYDVQDLRSECLEFVKNNLSVDTFCGTLTLALQHLEKELIDLATDFFAKHWQEIIVTVKWQSFVVENPIQSNEIMVKALVLKKK